MVASTLRALSKAYAPYEIDIFPYTKSVQGERGGLKNGKFERTYFMDAPLQLFWKKNVNPLDVKSTQRTQERR